MATTELGRSLILATAATVPDIAEAWDRPTRQLRWFLEDLIDANDPGEPKTLLDSLDINDDTGGGTEFTLIFPANSQNVVHALAVAVTKLSPAERTASYSSALGGAERAMRSFPSSDRAGPLGYKTGSTSYEFGPVRGDRMEPIVSYYETHVGDPSPLDGPIASIAGVGTSYVYSPEHFQTAARAIAHRLDPDQFPPIPTPGLATQS